MKYLSLTKKLFGTILVFGVFGLVLPSIWSVNALINIPVGVQETLQDSNIKTTPSQNSVFNFVPSEVNQALYGCPITTLSGSIGEAINVMQLLFSGVTFQELRCAEYTGKLPSVSLGLNNVVASATESMYLNMPYSGVNYLDQQVYALTNLGNVSAQPSDRVYYPGLGFNLQQPMQAFWGWSVNIVYGFLIVLIIVVAVAITFRQKLGGSAVVTLQNAIPNIALAMILVPLSFAITGLFIDAVTVGTNVIHGFLFAPGAPARDVFLESDNGYYPDDPSLSILKTGFGDKFKYDDNIEGFLESFLGRGGIIYNGIDAVLSVVEIVEQIPGVSDDTFSSDPYAWVGDILNFILQILIFFTAARIWWILVKKYLSILLAPIFSPFVFATIAIPGVGLKNVMTYLKSLASFSVFFIVTYAMFVLSIVLGSEQLASRFTGQVSASLYVPPMLSLGGLVNSLAPSNPAGENVFISFILGFISLVLFFNIPKTLKDIDIKMGTNKSSLMPILGDTFQSMNDSFGVGKGLGALALGAGAYGFNAAKGVKAGEEGSAQYYWKKLVTDRVAKLQSKIEDPTRGFVSKNSFRVRRFLYNRIGKATGVNVPSIDDSGNRMDGNIEFSWIIQGIGFAELRDNDVIMINIDKLQQAFNKLTSQQQPSTPNVLVSNVILKLTATNGLNLPAELNKDTVSVLAAEKQGALSVPGQKLDLFRIGADWFFEGGKKFNNHILFRLENDNILTKNLVEAKIPFKLIIRESLLRDLRSAFGDTGVVGGDAKFLKIQLHTAGPISLTLQITFGT